MGNRNSKQSKSANTVKWKLSNEPPKILASQQKISLLKSYVTELTSCNYQEDLKRLKGAFCWLDTGKTSGIDQVPVKFPKVSANILALFFDNNKKIIGKTIFFLAEGVKLLN